MVVRDAGAADAGEDDDFDADVVQPGKKPDAGKEPEGMPAKGLMGACAVDTNKIYTAVETDSLLFGTPLAVNPIDSVFALPYIGTSETCLDAVWMSTFEGAASAGPPTAALAVDECALVSVPSTTFVDDHWLIVMNDNRAQSDHVWVEPYDTETGKMGKAQLISEQPALSTAIITRRDGGVLVAWTEEDITGTGSVHVQELDVMGKPIGTPHIIDTWSAMDEGGVDLELNPKLEYRGLTLGAIGADGVGIGYWRYDGTFARSELVFQMLDKTGKPARPEWVLTRNAGIYASIDFDVNESGGRGQNFGSGGIVYTQTEGTTGRQLWFQEIDDTGAQPLLDNSAGLVPPVRILNSPFLGIDVSVAKLRLSYAIVYRALPAVNVTKSKIRIMFLDREGNNQGTSDLSYTSDTGGRTAIKAAYDGRVVVSWTEIDDETGKSKIKVVRLPCTGG